ncbi:MAG: MBL fold metallo-hydrolase [Dehalococcoidales bacterium]
MNITLLGAHNTETVNTRLSGLLIDGVLALDAGGLTSSLSLTRQKKLKGVLLTHQHYDHIRDLPALAINLYLAGATVNIYATLPVSEIITSYLFDGSIYPDYLKRPAENPTVKLTVLEPLKAEMIEGYNILPVPVSHSVPTVGYQVTSSDGKVIFYTADTGPGLTECWQQITPQLLIVEVTASNSFEKFGRESRHLTPNLLRQELIIFRELKGYLPRVVTVHMSPELEVEIRAELAVVAGELNTQIEPGYEGMEIDL